MRMAPPLKEIKFGICKWIVSSTDNDTTEIIYTSDLYFKIEYSRVSSKTLPRVAFFQSSGAFQDLAPADWDAAYQLTLLSVVRSVRLALPHFQRNGGGCVLAIVSSSVRRPIPNLLLSNVFRPAVQALCKSLSVELAADHIPVLARRRLYHRRHPAGGRGDGHLPLGFPRFCQDLNYFSALLK
jgi:hypothetical protein